MNLLRGKAGHWVTALWEGGSDILKSYVAFTAELRRVFDHPVQGQEASKRLLSLRQGNSSVAAYSVDFRILAAESEWDEVALRGVFIKGLSEELKDELALRDEPGSLEGLRALAIRIDNRLRERARERTSRPRRVSIPSVTPSTVASPSVSPFPNREPTTPSGDLEEPMQLGRARLTPSERQRRLKLKLCIYCGQAGHFLSSCPSTPKEQTHQ